MSEQDKDQAEQPQPAGEAQPEPDAAPPLEGEAEAAAAAAVDPDAPPDRDLEAEIAALNDKLLRTLAEGENQRRRAQKEREDTQKFAITGFARDILSVADNLHRALDALPEGAKAADETLASLVDGIELTERELLGIFERHGVSKVEPEGQKFDHNLHEAMFEVPTAEVEPGTVVQVIQAGYVLHGRLLRPARVGIAKALPEADAPPAGVDTTV